MRLFGQAAPAAPIPPPLTFAQQMQQQRLTGSQQLATQQQQDAAAKQQAQIQANQAATSAFYQNMQSMTSSGQDLARGVAERAAAWQPAQFTPQDTGSNMPLVLGLLGGGAVFMVIMVMLFKAASSGH